MKLSCRNAIRETIRKIGKHFNRHPLKDSIKISVMVCAIVTVICCTALFAGCGSAVLNKPPQNDLSTSVKPLLARQDNTVWLLSGKNMVKLGDVDTLTTEQGNPDSLSVMTSKSGWVYYVSGYNVDKGTGVLMRTHGDSGANPARVSADVSAACVSQDGQALFCKNVRDGAGELWICEPDGKTQMVAQAVVPDMFGFSEDGSQYYYVRNTGNAYEFNLASGSDTRMLYQAEPPEFRYFAAGFDGKGGLLFGLGRSLDEMSLYSDKDEKLTESGGQPVAVFGAADDFLYYRMEDDSLYNGSPIYQLYYKAPGKAAECISENCSGITFSGKSIGFFDIADSKTFLLAESSVDAGTEDSYAYTIDEDGTYVEQSVDAKMEELYLYTISGEKTYIGQASLYSNLVLGDNMTSVAAIQDDGLYLYRCVDGEWIKPGSLGTCYRFDWNDRYLYWLDTENVLHQCDLNSGTTKQLLDSAGFWLIDDEIYVCVDNESIGRLTDNGVETLFKAGGDVTKTAGGIYVSTFDGDIIYCAEDGTEQKSMLSEAVIMGGRGRLKFGYLSEQVKAALTVLKEDAEYYMDIADAEGAGILEPHGTPDEDAALALSLWRGTMPEDASRAAGFFFDAFSRMAKEGGLVGTVSEEVSDFLMMADSFLDMNEESPDTE